MDLYIFTKLTNQLFQTENSTFVVARNGNISTHDGPVGEATFGMLGFRSAFIEDTLFSPLSESGGYYCHYMGYEFPLWGHFLVSTDAR